MKPIWTVYTVANYASGNAYNVIATRWTDKGPDATTTLVAQFDSEAQAKCEAIRLQLDYDRLRNAMAVGRE